MIHHVEAETAEEIAVLLRKRGRTVVHAPRRIGKTRELLRYAEERYPNGRFAVFAKEESIPYIIKIHWCIYNNISFVDVVSKRLLGEKLEGEDVSPPQLFRPEAALYRTFNPSTPTFVDDWNIFTEEQQKAIIKRRLFIAAVGTRSKGESDGTEEDQDR